MMRIDIPTSLFDEIVSNAPISVQVKLKLSNPEKLLFRGPFGDYEVAPKPDEDFTETAQGPIRRYKDLK